MKIDTPTYLTYKVAVKICSLIYFSVNEKKTECFHLEIQDIPQYWII